MKEAAYDRMVAKIQSRLATNKTMLDAYYVGAGDCVSAEEANKLRGEQTALRAVLEAAELPSNDPPPQTPPKGLGANMVG